MVSATMFMLAPSVYPKGETGKGLRLTNAIINSAIETHLETEPASVYEIPVVFHVVYHTDIQNVSAEQLLSQLLVLNRDFRRHNLDASEVVEEFKSLAADVGLAFVLADTDPNNNPTEGITRTKTSSTVFSDNSLHKSAEGGADGWDASKYLNIWVAPLAPGLLGYASVAGEESSDFDGIAVHYEYVGLEGTAKEPFQLGRTLTHELGHYLGLAHLWGNGGCESDDGIEDTPMQDKAVAGCDLNQRSCDSRDMTQNFMNLADDDCLNFFTAGQAEVMRKTLEEHKPQLFRETVVLSRADVNDTDKGKIRFYQKDAGYCEFHLENIKRSGQFLLINSAGRKLWRKEVKHPGIPILTESPWSAGLYVAYYQTQNQVYSTKFILKE